MKFTEEDYERIKNQPGYGVINDDYPMTAGATYPTVSEAKQNIREGEVIEIPRTNKYSAWWVVYHCPERGVLLFDSKAEYRTYQELKLLERAGTITDLQLQPGFRIPGGANYYADFSYIEDGKRIVIDTKGYQTDVFKLKWKIVQEKYPDIEWRLVTK